MMAFVIGFVGLSLSASAEEDEKNVSKVAGQIVPDGDRHQYYLDHKTWNVSTNPFGLLYGSYSATGAYAFHKNFAVQLDLNYYDALSSSDAVTEMSLSVPIYFRKVYNGFFVDPGIVYKSTRDDGKTKNISGPQVMLGYTWMWDSGLNVTAAAGIHRNLQAKHDDQKIYGNASLRLGYAFN